MILSDFLTYVRQIYKRTDKDTEITQCYNDAINHVALAIPHAAYKYQSYVNTVNGQEDYALPTNIMHLMHPIRILEGSAASDSGWQLDHLDKESYDSFEPNPNRSGPSTGSPSVYTVYSGSLLLNPIPDSGDYLIEINWTKKPVTLSATTDYPSLGSEWNEVLRQMVLARMYQVIELFQEADYWRSQYEDQMGNPVGTFYKLINIERDKEHKLIGQVVNNEL